MKISELTNAPQWLKDAIVENEDVEIVNNYVIWKNGMWKCGVWKSGVWEGGTWKNGMWEGGVWEGGTWKNGVWEGGVWKCGAWEGGAWEDGTWEGGVWKCGVWEGGVWKCGAWEGGTHSMMSKYIPLINGDNIEIGCKRKTIKEWKAWFDGSKEFETKRNSREFKMIYAHFKACAAYVEAMK